MNDLYDWKKQPLEQNNTNVKFVFQENIHVEIIKV